MHDRFVIRIRWFVYFNLFFSRKKVVCDKCQVLTISCTGKNTTSYYQNTLHRHILQHVTSVKYLGINLINISSVLGRTCHQSMQQSVSNHWIPASELKCQFYRGERKCLQDTRGLTISSVFNSQHSPLFFQVSGVNCYNGDKRETVTGCVR